MVMNGDAEAQKGWDTIQEFLADIYGPDKVEQVWLAGFQDIEARPSWFGMQGITRLRSRIGGAVGSSDLYFCSGLIRQGAHNRTVGEVVAQPLLYADDIGTKVPREKWDGMFAMGFPEPTFKIETSPGNETWGWVLSGDAMDAARWDDLALIRAYMIERGLTDALHDATRYLRLPWGHNSKPKYRGETGKGVPPAVGYVEWKPGRKADIDVIGRILIGGADWRQAEVPASAMTAGQIGAAVGAGALNRTASMDDPIVQMAEVVGLEPKPSNRAGVVDALCPNWQAHGDRAETGFAFLGGDLCHCNHASCEALRSPDFVAMINAQYEDHVSALEVQSKRPVDLPLSANHFRARKDFERHGGLDPDKAEVVEREAEELAVRNERRAAQREEAFEAALTRLAERFVWVKSAEAFFDREERAFYSASGLARHDAVTAHIPAGGAGAKAAGNILANQPNRVVAHGLAYVPGEKEVIVDAETESGMIAPHVNSWRPSRYEAVQGNPSVWLRAMKHVFHEPYYLEWILDWMSWVVQNPTSRTPLIPFVVSGQGAGKDTVLRPFQQLLGTQNCTSVSTGQIVGAFNGFLRKRLLILQEAKLDAGGNAYNRVKDWTGSATGRVEINEKHLRPQSIAFVGVFIALSNDEGAVKGIDPDDRRFVPIISDAGRLDEVFLPKDHEELDTAAEIGRVRYFLESRDVTNFNPYSAPADKTGSRARVVAAGLSAPARAAYEQVVSGEFSERRVISYTEVMDSVRRGVTGSAGKNVTYANVRDGLKAAGCVQILPRGSDQIKVGGKKMRLWTGPRAPKDMRDVRSHQSQQPKKFADMYLEDLERVQNSLISG